jgi:hypothetical protein
MSFATYGALKTRVANETNRTDSGFVAEVPGFVALAEQRIFHGSDEPMESRALRVRFMETRVTLALTDGEGSPPADFLEAKRLEWPSEPSSLPVFQPPETFFRQRSPLTTGGALAFTHEAGKIYLTPKLTGTMALVYYAKPPPLVNDGDTNWLLINAPGVMFQAVLIEAYRYLRNDAMALGSFAAFKAAIDGLRRSDRSARVSGSYLYPRVRT